MGRSTFYLSQSDIDSIQNEIATIFAEGSVEEMTLNLIELRKELDYITKKVELMSFGSKNNKYRIKNTSQEKRKLMAEAYLIIFKIREFLLNEKINYRYYFNASTSNGMVTGAKVIEFEEDELLKYIKFGKQGIQIASHILKKQEGNQQYQSLIDAHFTNLIAGIQNASGSYFKVVHSYIMNRYEQMNPGLRKQTGKGAGSYQVFTMGHVYEAIDIAFSEAIEEKKIQDFSFIERATYGKYLNYDSIAGTKGGDNAITMTQIKANAADVLDFTTILKDLEQLKNIFSINVDKEAIKEGIKKLYLDETKYQDIEAFEGAAEAATEKLFNLLKVNKT